MLLYYPKQIAQAEANAMKMLEGITADYVLLSEEEVEDLKNNSFTG